MKEPCSTWRARHTAKCRIDAEPYYHMPVCRSTQQPEQEQPWSDSITTSMSKRALSPALLPPAKRFHASGHTNTHPIIRVLSFENSLYDELILCIFGYLSWTDLCTTQATSRNWARLAADNELWRKQYLNVYGRTRLRGAKGFIARLDGREVRPLPGRAKADQHKDWKWMFRISSNWRKGMHVHSMNFETSNATTMAIA